MVTIDKTTKNADRSCGRFPSIETRLVDYSNRKVLQCRALFFADPQGDGYTAIARNLPGVVSEGDNLAEAIANITDAFTESVLSYVEHGERVPWGDSLEIMEGAVPERELLLLVKIDG